MIEANLVYGIALSKIWELQSIYSLSILTKAFNNKLYLTGQLDISNLSLTYNSNYTYGIKYKPLTSSASLLYYFGLGARFFVNGDRTYLDWGLYGSDLYGRISFTSTANTLYNIQFGNHFIKNADTNTNYVSGGLVSEDLHECSPSISITTNFEFYNASQYIDGLLVHYLVPISNTLILDLCTGDIYQNTKEATLVIND